MPLAGFRSGAAYAAAERVPVATPAAVPDDATTAALSDACVDLGQWLEPAHDRIEQMHGVHPENVTLEDAATLAPQAPQFAALAEALHSLEAAGERLEQVETELARIGEACGWREERHS